MGFRGDVIRRNDIRYHSQKVLFPFLWWDDFIDFIRKENEPYFVIVFQR